MPLFYKPELAVVGDVIPFYDDGYFKPFYLRNFRNNMDKDHRDSWVMLTTDDQLHFTEHDTGIDAATGSVVKHEGVYHMFATIFKSRPMKNVIIHAVSSDLDKWTILDGEELWPDGVIYDTVHFRDPFVFWNAQENCWWMLVAARTMGRTQRQGCVGLCKSKDLFAWEICPPLYAPQAANCAYECPDYFEWNGWYYLVYSSYSDRYQTLYRKSRHPYGPWMAPKRDTFDGRAFYAAKTASDGHRRFVYGWNPTKTVNEHDFDSRADLGTDNHTWDWGGHLIVHELAQTADGDLIVRPPQAVREALAQEAPAAFRALSGTWRQEEDGLHALAHGEYAAALLGDMPGACRIEMDVRFDEGVRRLGVAMEVDDAFDAGYYMTLEPARGRMQYRTHMRMTPGVGRLFPWEVEMERPHDLAAGAWHRLCILRDADVLVMYVDDEAALSARMYDLSGRSLGVFAQGGEAVFRGIRICR